MSVQVRDTEFGHFWRRFSSSAAFRYPDEIDSSLKEKSLAGDTGITSSTSSKERERLRDPHSTSDNVIANGDSSSPSDEKEDQKRAFIVDWYGHDDPEVRNGYFSTKSNRLIPSKESSELAKRLESIRNLPDLSSQLRNIHRQLYIRSR